MRIVAIETTDRTGSLAALDQGQVLVARELDPQQRSAQSLAPALKALLEQVGWRPTEVELVAVTIGPGSFTGLRVGIATAKTFAYAVGAEVLGVNTLEVIAHQAPAEFQRLAVALDAQRRQVFAATFRRDEAGHLLPERATAIVDEAEWIEQLPPGAAVTGPVLKRLRDRLSAHIPVIDPIFWPPTAAATGQLAWRDHQAGRRDDLWQLKPDYYRDSAAEEKLRERG